MVYKSDTQFPEITSGAMSYCHVDPKMGKQCRIHFHPSNLDSQAKADIAGVNHDAPADDPNDDIISVNEYVNDGTIVNTNSTPQPVNKTLSRLGKTVQVLAQTIGVAGIGGGTISLFLLNPFIAAGIAVAGIGVMVGLNILGKRLKLKAGMSENEAKKNPGDDSVKVTFAGDKDDMGGPNIGMFIDV